MTPLSRVKRMIRGAVLAAPLLFAGAAPSMPQDLQVPDLFQISDFSDMSGWQKDDHFAALKSFVRFCDADTLPSGGLEALYIAPEDWAHLCVQAEASLTSKATARRFFETQFTPLRVTKPGFLTGYFEPEVDASRTRSDKYSHALLKKPEGLVPVSKNNRPPGWPDHLSHGRELGGTLEEMPDRSAIMDGALDREALELVWLQDPIDAYFIHVQGSARLKLDDGTSMRVGYAGKTGHPYTGIGRLLVKRGEGTAKDFTMTGLRAWLQQNPELRDDLFRQNRSYIFFREVEEVAVDQGPVGAAGVSLAAGRSLAVDNRFIAYGLPVFVASDLPDIANPNSPFRRLLIADDTGSAIRGASRGDIFVGSGKTSGSIAGDIRHPGEFTVLVPTTALQTSSKDQN